MDTRTDRTVYKVFSQSVDGGSYYDEEYATADQARAVADEKQRNADRPRCNPHTGQEQRPNPFGYHYLVMRCYRFAGYGYRDPDTIYRTRPADWP